MFIDEICHHNFFIIINKTMACKEKNSGQKSYD